jgi:hypothetical protein
LREGRSTVTFGANFALKFVSPLTKSENIKPEDDIEFLDLFTAGKKEEDGGVSQDILRFTTLD